MPSNLLPFLVLALFLMIESYSRQQVHAKDTATSKEPKPILAPDNDCKTVECTCMLNPKLCLAHSPSVDQSEHDKSKEKEAPKSNEKQEDIQSV